MFLILTSNVNLVLEMTTFIKILVKTLEKLTEGKFKILPKARSPVYDINGKAVQLVVFGDQLTKLRGK